MQSSWQEWEGSCYNYHKIKGNGPRSSRREGVGSGSEDCKAKTEKECEKVRKVKKKINRKYDRTEEEQERVRTMKRIIHMGWF